ncbi:MAG: hypothetical protein AAGK22_07935 [Acidobacteriota bacterium]
MKSGEQLTWALLAVTALALPKWVFGAAVFVQPEVLSQTRFWILPMILVSGYCSLRLVDTSQPLSALFGLVAAGYSTTPICNAQYDCERYQVAALLPVVIWVIAATFPHARSRWARISALLVSAYGMAIVLTQWAGWNPFFWPAVFDPAFRVWEWVGLCSLAGLLAIRARTGRFRLPLAKSRALSLAFVPALLLLTLDFLLQSVGTLRLEESPLSTLLVVAANLALGGGMFTLTRAEIAQHKESRHEAEQRNPHRL